MASRFDSDSDNSSSVDFGSIGKNINNNANNSPNSQKAKGNTSDNAPKSANNNKESAGATAQSGNNNSGVASAGNNASETASGIAETGAKAGEASASAGATAGEVGASATAGVASGGTTLAVQAATETATNIIKRFSEKNNSLDTEYNTKLLGVVVGIVLGLLMLITVVFGSVMHWMFPSLSQKQFEIMHSFSEAFGELKDIGYEIISDDNGFLEDMGLVVEGIGLIAKTVAEALVNVVVDVIDKNSEYIEIPELDAIQTPGKYYDVGESPYEDSLKSSVKLFQKEISRYKQDALDEIEIICSEYGFDEKLTKESFNEQPNPYGDKFENVNYSEIISIMSLSEKYNINNLDIKELKALFDNEESMKKLYIMTVTEAKDSNDIKYGEVRIYKYSLSQIYSLFGIAPFDENYLFTGCPNNELLDYQLALLNVYGETVNLGSKERTPLYRTVAGTYSSQTERDLADLENYRDTLPSEQQSILELAVSCLGTTYSQAKRAVSGYFDCSSFVAWVYAQKGVYFSSNAYYNGSGTHIPTAASICKYLESKGCQIEYSQMQVGDLIFYSSNANGRYKNITHVALYAGNGKIIDASSSKGQVVHRNIWGINQIVSTCRPSMLS